MITCGVGAVSPNGVLGDPAGATAEEGRWLLSTLIDEVCDRLAGGWFAMRVALVTGAARGIGAAAVDALVGDGYAVTALDPCTAETVPQGVGYPLAARKAGAPARRCRRPRVRHGTVGRSGWA